MHFINFDGMGSFRGVSKTADDNHQGAADVEGECQCPCTPGHIHAIECQCRLGCKCYEEDPTKDNPHEFPF